MSPPRDPPILIPAPSPIPNPAILIFLHGLGDSADPWASMATQFRTASKLPQLTWLLPNAPFHHETLQPAWYTPTPLSPFPSQRPELDDPEDEASLLESVKYVEGLIDEAVEQRGVPVGRVFVGGFSQGCAVALLLGLGGGRYGGRIGGVVGLCGYLPLGAERVRTLRDERDREDAAGREHGMKVFYMRGGKDMLVPQRYYRMAVEGIRELGVADNMVTAKVYDGLGHAVSGQVLRDVCAWLESALQDPVT